MASESMGIVETSGICQGAAPLSYGSPGRVSCWSPLGTCLGFLGHPKTLYLVAVAQLRVAFCLD